MIYNYAERKIVAVINEALPTGKAMNALGHMAFAAGHYTDGSWMGQNPIRDADGKPHRGIARHAFIVVKASAEEINAIRSKETKNEVEITEYMQEMFDTSTDEKLVKVIQGKKTNELEYHAILLVGMSETVAKLTGHLKLYK
ncbi:MAG: DUF2000 domain-containing protein [archaeon]